MAYDPTVVPPSPHGSLVDINAIQKRLGRLKRDLQQNQMTRAKALSTTILADVNALNTLIQAATTNHDLSADPVIPLRDSQYQTSNS